MSSTTKPQTIKASAVDVWGARGPQGTIVRSSISNYRSVAERWRLKRGPGYELVHFTVNLKDVPTFKIEAKMPKSKKVTDAKKLGILQTEETATPTKKAAAPKKAAATKKPKKTTKKTARKATKSATPAARRKRVQSSPETQAPAAPTVVTETNGAAL